MATINLGPAGSGQTYTYLQTAINAANDGDIILMDPGIHDVGGVNVNKAVTLKANTQDPVANPVQIRGGAYYPSTPMIFNAQPTQARIMYVEGVTFRGSYASSGYGWIDLNTNSNCTVKFNKCRFYAENSAQDWLFEYIRGAGLYIFENCTSEKMDNGFIKNVTFDSGTNNPQVHFIKHQRYNQSFLIPPPGWGASTYDTVIAETPGYGWDDPAAVMVVDPIGPKIKGVLKEAGSPVIRRINIYRRSDGKLVAGGMSAADGAFEFDLYGYQGVELFLVALDDTNAAPDYNAIVLDRLVPVDPNA